MTPTKQDPAGRWLDSESEVSPALRRALESTRDDGGVGTLSRVEARLGVILGPAMGAAAGAARGPAGGEASVASGTRGGVAGGEAAPSGVGQGSAMGPEAAATKGGAVAVGSKATAAKGVSVAAKIAIGKALAAKPIVLIATSFVVGAGAGIGSWQLASPAPHAATTPVVETPGRAAQSLARANWDRPAPDALAAAAPGKVAPVASEQHAPEGAGSMPAAPAAPGVAEESTPPAGTLDRGLAAGANAAGEAKARQDASTTDAGQNAPRAAATAKPVASPQAKGARASEGPGENASDASSARLRAGTLSRVDPRGAPAASAGKTAGVETTNAATATSSALDDEVALLQAARAAVTGSPAKALALTEEHRARFPRGHLAQEREAVAVDALVRAGRTAEAAARARRFLSDYPESSLGPRMRAVAGER